ncbi:hypothetical protein pipiens_010574 [Culex pipiens pipiens]|uniref:Transmembrane protein n=1 Tax=Culex pipiens pipiens TaxID=38569 RepID=A0ABD1D9M1_CULPP|nr:uncharacterized protein LOC119766196 [Culex quinquefasciatus]
MLRSPTRPTFFRPHRPDMPSFSRKWFVCFPASPCFGNSSAFRKVTLLALVCASQQWPAFRRVVLPVVVCARPSSSPRFRNSTVFRRAVLTAVDLLIFQWLVG